MTVDEPLAFPDVEACADAARVRTMGVHYCGFVVVLGLLSATYVSTVVNVLNAILRHLRHASRQKAPPGRPPLPYLLFRSSSVSASFS